MILTERVKRFFGELRAINETSFQSQRQLDIENADRHNRYGEALFRDYVSNPYNPKKQLPQWIAFDLGRARALRINLDLYPHPYIYS